MAVDFQGPQITSRTIKADTPSVAVGDTSGAYAAMANGLATAGDNIGAALATIEPKSGDRLQAKIDKATAQGKDAKAARLTGRKERRDVRDTNRASRIKAKNKDRKEKLVKKEFFKGQKFNEKQKEKGGTTSDSHLFKPTISLKPKGISEMEPKFSLASPFDMKTFDKFSTIAKKI